jgi:redox-sensitive bicupin YhaK (pirin superfamily)
VSRSARAARPSAPRWSGVSTPKLSRRDLLAAGAVLPVAAALGACRPAVAPSRSSGAPAAAQAIARRVRQVVDAQPVTDGAGVHLARSLGAGALPMLDPFLMLDEFRSDRPEDYIAGFPSHPHRGFETVTYMLHGAMEHRDSLGNHGRLGPGSTQWMTAGHGIIHSEMPRQERGLMHGFQLWVNLPAAHKMTPPRYQDLAPERIETIAMPEGPMEGTEVRLVAGELEGRVGPVEGIVTAPHMLDVTLPRRGRFEHALPRSHNAFVYVIDGAARFGGEATRVSQGQLAVLDRGGDALLASSDRGARFLLLAGQPIGEPVARRGPFVMNTDDEIRQAIADYQSGRLTRI